MCGWIESEDSSGNSNTSIHMGTVWRPLTNLRALC